MDVVLDLDGVGKDFSSGPFFARRRTAAVTEVSLRVHAGQTVGLVGESGSGKSTLGRMAVGLLTPDRGRVTVHGQPLTSLTPKKMRPFRRRMQMVFQDSSNSLNPRMTLEDLLVEPFRAQDLHTRAERRNRAAALADEVGLARTGLGRLPHEFSGGQRQRISIARALALEPDLLVADEPVSALDVSVQAQILNLFKDIQQARGFAMLFVSHDMAVVEFISDQVAVMRAGALVEFGTRDEIFDSPREPYTRTLLDAAPSL
ncbi:ATP-binding cassette domain-containing protein [Lentzea sp. BCCO 10_0061]|uniref:ATP-binding cassette domain-containing protein n=1 Tax=Lentzea sokolovensis TaxID=3095429 RepID=A0ABU4V8Z1_9PSEU|nr:ATP-binding cassette domain-containing protein [Lentzea sp. BCCO 10_0061]MDX8147335.1 ATP-binding cassette domain-containing protein [Lentzea sp. BCCO 10_0061]